MGGVGASAGSAELTAALRTALGGDEIAVWADCGDEVIVHAGAAAVRLDGDAVLAEIPLESDQTSRQVLVVPFVLGAGPAVTSSLPWGDERLAQRWGPLLVELAWEALEPLLRPRDADVGIHGRAGASPRP